MKNHFISTLTAIALAVPLGIGGLTLTAPATATHAEAGWNDFVNWVKDTHQKHVEFWRETVPDAFQNSFRRTRERHQQVVAAFDRFGDELHDEFVVRTRLRHERIATAFNNHFGTCSTAAIWACDSSIHAMVNDFDDAVHKAYQPGRLPAGSNGTDQAAWDYLVERENNGHSNARDARIMVFGEDAERPLQQVTLIDAFDVTNNPNPFTPAQRMELGLDAEGEQAQVVSQHRDSIIELQDEVTGNTALILENVAALTNLSQGVIALATGVHENRQGIALSYAFDAPSLAPGETFGINGRWGHFEDENGVAMNAAFRLGAGLTASLGVGTTELTSSENGVFGAHAGVEYKF